MLKNLIKKSILLQLGRKREQLHKFSIRMHNSKASEEIVNEKTENCTKSFVNPFGTKSKTQLVTPNANYNKQDNELSMDEKEKRLKVLRLEVDIANQEGRRVPSLSCFQNHHWEHVLSLPSKSARIKYYSYLWQIEVRKESTKRKKEEKDAGSTERIEKIRKERAETEHIVYGLGHVSLFLRIYDATITQWMNHRLVRAMQFAPKIVFDCSYDEYMTKREAENAAKQLMLSFAENRQHDNPFDLHFCSVNLNTPCMNILQRYIPTMMNPEFPMNVHHKCFTDIFPKENLVYLTPHCHTDLMAYNPDDVYIVGAMVDTVNNQPLSLAKAKRLGLRMARLPLDHYLQWSAGSGKSLTLNQMIKIMLDLRHTGDWMAALKHVPSRKIINLKRDSENFRSQMNKHSNRVNVRIERLLGKDGEDESKTPHNIRSRKENLQFNISTWASKKTTRQ